MEVEAVVRGRDVRGALIGVVDLAFVALNFRFGGIVAEQDLYAP
jgi:hypothetical protein